MRAKRNRCFAAFLLAFLGLAQVCDAVNLSILLSEKHYNMSDAKVLLTLRAFEVVRTR